MDKSVGKAPTGDLACTRERRKSGFRKKLLINFSQLWHQLRVKVPIGVASAGIIAMCISYCDLAVLAGERGCHWFVMRRCDTGRAKT